MRTAVERLAVLAALTAGGPLLADSPVSYVNTWEIVIPFRLSPGKPVTEVILHASKDGKSYGAHATVEASKRSFDYTANADGLYYFLVQTKDSYGTLDPPSVAGRVLPLLRVVVDTAQPKIDLRAVEPPKGSAAVEWDVSDPNLDLGTLKLEYRVVDGGRWVQLNPDKVDRAHFDWNPPGTGPIEVRLTVADLAKNVSSQVVRLNPVPGKDPGPSAAAPGMPRVIHVRTRDFNLNFKVDGVGPSRVKHVEVWMTRDTRAWQKLAVVEGEKMNEPVPIKVITAGRYGFTLRPVSGVGRAIDTPAIGASPQIWVEVDESPPDVQVLDVKVGEGADAGFMTVSYRAADKWLKDAPITVLVGPSKDGPWTAIESNQANNGSLRLPTKCREFEFFLRVEAADEAGNKGGSVWPESVKVDLSRPEVKDITVIGVEGGTPPASRLPGSEGKE